MNLWSAEVNRTMPGRPFLHVPGPTNIPDRILRALAQPVLDHRGAEFAALTRELLDGLRRIFQTTRGTVVLFPGSGTGGWEAALVNTLAPGDRILAVTNGAFGAWHALCARALGLVVDELALDWGAPADPAAVGERLRADHAHAIKAVHVVHKETSTGVTSSVAAVRAALDEARHPALLLVDTVSSLGSIDFRFDEWGVDVAVAGSQKGLMLPPGMALLCVSPRALAAGERGGSPRYFFDWRPVIEQNQSGFFPYTPATTLLLGMREALRMLLAEGLPQVFGRHRRLAEGVRRAVRAWDLPIVCRDPQAYSATLTAVALPEGMDSRRLLSWSAAHLNLSLGAGLGKLQGRVFRIGHLGWLNEVEVLGVLGGLEVALHACGLRVTPGAGPGAAAAWFIESPHPAAAAEARSGDDLASTAR
jgi:alanine-glyoxylate transaminase/serine-glyoxylate transaminase/serine-pyruvate transaminase